MNYTSLGQRYRRHGEPILAYLVDHLGTVRAAVNRDGIVVETRDYAPFGESIAHVGAFSVQHRFTGQPQDDLEGGLYNYGARFYNPKWGRFVSPDEMVQSFDAQGLNPYTYVLNRPTSWTDPTGNYAGVGGVSAGGLGASGFGGFGGYGSLGHAASAVAFGWSGAGAQPNPVRGPGTGALMDFEIEFGQLPNYTYASPLLSIPQANPAWIARGLALLVGSAIQLYRLLRRLERAARRPPTTSRSLPAAKPPRLTPREIDALRRAGEVPDRGGLTRAGRALAKHGGREGSAFPKASGDPAAINKQGQEVLDQILSKVSSTKPNRFGGTDYIGPGGRGARYDASGNFRGFLEP